MSVNFAGYTDWDDYAEKSRRIRYTLLQNRTLRLPVHHVVVQIEVSLRKNTSSTNERYSPWSTTLWSESRLSLARRRSPFHRIHHQNRNVLIPGPSRCGPKSRPSPGFGRNNTLLHNNCFDSWSTTVWPNSGSSRAFLDLRLLTSDF